MCLLVPEELVSMAQPGGARGLGHHDLNEIVGEGPIQTGAHDAVHARPVQRGADFCFVNGGQDVQNSGGENRVGKICTSKLSSESCASYG